MDPSHAEQQEEFQPPDGDVPEELVDNPSYTHIKMNIPILGEYVVDGKR